MDTRKFEYLETMRDTILQGNYEGLKEYVDHIRSRVNHDPDFEDIFLEVGREKYQLVISLIEEMIYKDMQNDINSFEDSDDEEMEDGFSEDDIEKLGKVLDLDDDMEEEISFESFDDEEFADRSDEDY